MDDSLAAVLRSALDDVAGLAHERVFASDGDFAEAAAALDSMRRADKVALAIAQANGYAVAKPDGHGRRRPARPAGRALDVTCLERTGVAALLRSGRQVDLNVVAQQLAEHLAGPPIPIYDYAVLDLDLDLVTPDPIPVVDEWELVTPTAAELRAALPVSAAEQHWRGWDPSFCARLAMLRRVDPEKEPVRSFRIWFDLNPAHRLWRPLLALSLYKNPVVHLYARYVVEPGRHVEPLFERYATEGVSVDGEEWEEVPALGDFEVNEADLPQFRTFLAAVGPLVEQSQAAPVNNKAAARLRRATEHFLTAGENAYGEGDVFSESNAETVLHYVIALEALLSAAGEGTSDLSRKVAQRAAMLAGRHDDDRVDVHDFVRSAYKARSKYAHGDEADEVATSRLREIVRRCLLARLVLGDRPTGYRSLAQLADEALLSQRTRRIGIVEPLQAFASAVGGP